MSKELTKSEGSNLPALVNTPALEIDSDDVVLPRLRIGQKQSGAVEDRLVNIGDIFSTQGKDDPSPVVHFEADAQGDGVLIHVIGMRKGKSLQDDGELQTWAFNDPDAPPEARTTYDYAVVLPEADDGEEVPYKFLLSGASTNAAKFINTVLKKNSSRGPAWSNAFRIKSVARTSSSKGGGKTFNYRAAVVKQVEADPVHVATAEQLAAVVAGSGALDEAPVTSKPAI